MKEKVFERAEEVYGEHIPKNVVERLKEECKKIEERNLETDLVSLAEFIKKHRKMGKFIIGDGILKESLVAYLLEIVYLNPMDFPPLKTLNFSKKQWEIIAPKKIHEEYTYLQENTHMSLHFKSWFKLELLNKLEGLGGIYSKKIPLEEQEVVRQTFHKVKLGSPVRFLEENYSIGENFGVQEEKLATFYDYIKYDKEKNEEYSSGLLISYYLIYYKIHFPEEFYRIYIPFLIDSLVEDARFPEKEKMQELAKQLILACQEGYSFKDILEGE